MLHSEAKIDANVEKGTLFCIKQNISIVIHLRIPFELYVCSEILEDGTRTSGKMVIPIVTYR